MDFGKAPVSLQNIKSFSGLCQCLSVLMVFGSMISLGAFVGLLHIVKRTLDLGKESAHLVHQEAEIESYSSIGLNFVWSFLLYSFSSPWPYGLLSFLFELSKDFGELQP